MNHFSLFPRFSWARRAAPLLLVFLAACTAPPKPPVVLATADTAPYTPFAVSKWEMLPDWQTIDLRQTWAAFWQSCSALKNKPGWQSICARAYELTQPDNNSLRAFFEEGFTPYQVFNPDGSSQGLITGYYEPKLAGSRVKTARFRYPLYAAPDDLLAIDLGDVYPQLKDLRLRGRLQGNRIVPYYKRSEIDNGKAPLQGRELFWVDNAVDLFFLQIQGSGRIELPDGSLVKVGYAEQNGHPYTSIGKKLVEMGAFKLEESSMQNIKLWAQKNPEKLDSLLEFNPSYVFFRELPNELPAPLGALGVPLTNEYSLAVDARTIPLGAPVFLATTYPNTVEPLNRLMLAQDTGGAIRGAVRGDFFWGFGEQAGNQAGRMKQSGQMWVLFPKGAEPALGQ
ncbi:MAG: transglycosylase [Gallionellales bacterium RIFCSPLOWO2_02_FULL_57_47]|nr:MAG: transglycosylase [Gallionellales bacterium RIFCSPLOWO2_02_FULL_57_47]OGT14970.1 MAG: transglycosylase [Gallionellales bacterium RIFCSPHIGHO2_02_FULL_57_16]